jgi:hypothetical protein
LANLWAKATSQQNLQTFNRSLFCRKVRDIVGLYLNPPENALVLCVDEKSQCQALERTQPALPLGFGYAGGYTYDYVRHGTLKLFAALDVATGGVIAKPKKRHRHQELKHQEFEAPDLEAAPSFLLPAARKKGHLWIGTNYNGTDRSYLK